MFAFTFSMFAMVMYATALGSDVVFVSDIVAVSIMSVLLTISEIVLYSNRGIKRVEFFIRHVIRLVLLIIITLATATYRGWILWNNPVTVLIFLGFVMGAYIIGTAIIFYESKKMADKMNEKLKLRNKE